MMKKRILALALTMGLFSNAIRAQALRLENIPASTLSALGISPDQETFCSIHTDNSEEAENGNLKVVFYNPQMMEMSVARLNVPQTTVLLTSCFSGEVMAFILGDASTKTRTIMTVDRHGNIMQKKEEENASPLQLNPDSYIGLYAANPTEFVMVQATGAKNGEVVAERFNMALDPGTKLTIKPENGKMTVEQAEILNDNVYLLCKVTTGTNNDKIQYVLKMANLASGEVAYSIPFGDGTQSALPASMHINDDMSVDMTGVIFSESDMDKTPDGLAWMHTDERGNPMYRSLPWSELLQKTNNKIIKEISQGKLDILLEDMFKLPGSESRVLLGEVFEKSNGGAGTANFAVKDMLLFKFTDDGELLDVITIEKTPKLATVKGSGATGSKYLLAKKMHDNHFFTYRTHELTGEKVNLLYRYDDGKTNTASVLSVSDSLIDKKDIAVVPLNEETEAEINKASKSKKNSDKNIAVVTMNINLDEKNATGKYDELILMKENHALVQQYKDGVYTARIIGIPMR